MRIRDLREDNDLTQAQVGQVINKSQQGYNHIEAGRAELKIDDLIKLLYNEYDINILLTYITAAFITYLFIDIF